MFEKSEFSQYVRGMPDEYAETLKKFLRQDTNAPLHYWIDVLRAHGFDVVIQAELLAELTEKAIAANRAELEENEPPTCIGCTDPERWPLHEDATGFHHIVRGESVPCTTAGKGNPA